MPEAAIALGSNLGDRARTLHTATERLEALGHVTAVSSFYDTAPVGLLDQPRFLNAAVLLETSLSPVDLLQALLSIERTLGRTRENVPPKGPRTLDLDLLFYGETVLSTRDLTLPHPALHERAFVLEPLAEIAPAWVHPLFHATPLDLLAALAR